MKLLHYTIYILKRKWKDKKIYYLYIMISLERMQQLAGLKETSPLDPNIIKEGWGEPPHDDPRDLYQRRYEKYQQQLQQRRDQEQRQQQERQRQQRYDQQRVD